MSLWSRWSRFCLVGLCGIGVQLAVLAGLRHILQPYPSLAIGLAVEITLLHNFVWHLRYTWSDRLTAIKAWHLAMLRFHISNGLISIVGNLWMTRWLMEEKGLPLLLANLIAITICSTANFCLGHVWSFSTKPTLP